MVSLITYFKHGWKQIHKKRNGTTELETTKYSDDGNTSVTTKEIQNSVGVEL